MNFFHEQQKTRRKSFWLIVLYLISVLMLAILLSFILDNLWTAFFEDSDPLYKSLNVSGFDWIKIALSKRSFFIIFFILLAFILIFTLFKLFDLRAGGRTVAEALGGRLISYQSENFYEKRLLNIVEEMALASGIAVPQIYILPEEDGINAFAAGYTINDAVIGVTAGSLKILNRDELQALIAHEFSHVLNGDMRLNLRFVALLFGLMCIGQMGSFMLSRGYLLNTRRDSKGGLLILFIFIASFLIFLAGLLSTFFGRIVQAAINRQREYLADASAVQYTRSKALASVLKKIGAHAEGSKMHTAAAASYGHLFFGPNQQSLFSTHPPLSNRIYKIDPDWDGKFIKPEIQDQKPPYFTKDSADKDFAPYSASLNRSDNKILPMGMKNFTGDSDIGSSDLGYDENLFSKINIAQDYKFLGAEDNSSNAHKLDSLNYPRDLNLPKNSREAIALLSEAIKYPLDSCYLFFAVLLDDEEELLQKQLACLHNKHQALKLKAALTFIPSGQHLALVERSIPSLKALSKKQYNSFEEVAEKIIFADEHYSFKEWIFFQLIKRQVGIYFEAKPNYEVQYIHLKNVKGAIVYLLGSLARMGGKENDAVLAAFKAGLMSLGLSQRETQNIILPLEDFHILEKSLTFLQSSTFDIKKSFLEASFVVANYDGEINSQEAMYLRIFNLCLDVPLNISPDF